MKSLPILSIVTWLPTLGALIILILFKKGQSDQIKKFATAWFGVAFVASLVPSLRAIRIHPSTALRWE